MRIVKFSSKHRRAFLATLRESSPEFGKAWALRMKEIFSAGYGEPYLLTFTVLEAGEPVAFFATRREVEALVLYFIIIPKAQQGKGIGSAIVSFVEKMAKNDKAKFLRLDIYSGKPVLSFYKKLGFKVGGKVRFYEEENDDQTFLYKRV